MTMKILNHYNGDDDLEVLQLKFRASEIAIAVVHTNLLRNALLISTFKQGGMHIAPAYDN